MGWRTVRYTIWMSPTHDTVPPEELRAYLFKALQWSRSGDLAAAERFFTEAMRKFPHLAHPCAERGWVRQRRGDLEGALADAEAALERAKDGNATRALVLRAMVQTRQGNPQQALTDLDAALALDPHDVDALFHRAQLHNLHGNPTGALEDCTALMPFLKKDQRPPVLAERAAARRALGDPSGALADLDQALAMQPQDPCLRRARADLREQQFNPAGAMEDLDVLEILQPDNATVQWDRGRMLCRLNRTFEAIDAFTAGLSLEPGHVRLLIGRADAHATVGALDAAAADLSSARQIEPDNPEILDRLHTVLRALGRQA